MSSGVYAVEMDWTFECADCGKENEDITCWVEGDLITEVCQFCNYEKTVSL